MSTSFTVRLDDQTEQELAPLVEATGGNRNAAIAKAIHRAARALMAERDAAIYAADAAAIDDEFGPLAARAAKMPMDIE
jgi:predicted transcriptional regulator